MKFCSNCGAEVTYEIPSGDSLPRHVCSACGRIHYQNPRIVVGAIPEWNGKILLCRRAIEPRYGLWTLPAGFLENGETIEQGAARETLEEARAEVEIGDLYTLYNLPHVNQVYIIFRACLLRPEFAPGAETLEARLFSEVDMPWSELAFATIRATLTHYYEDRRAGAFRFHLGTITSPPRETPTAA
ncbi:MAG: NUDIX hydrolase [Burkholderiales bacterium]